MTIVRTSGHSFHSEFTDSETKLDDGMMSQELQETMMNLMGSHKLSDNVKLTDRILRLIIEVKALNSA